MLISFILLATLAMISIPMESEGASSPAVQPVKFYMYGESDNGNLSSVKPTSSDDETAECPDGGDKQFQQASVGIWRSVPFKRAATISGTVSFQVWAKTTQGTVDDVQFTCQLTVNGDQDQVDIQTNTNDTDSSAKLFQGSENLQGPNTMSVGVGDFLEIEIIYDGNDDFLDDSGDTVILYGSKPHPSGIETPFQSVVIDFEESDIEVNDENADEDQETIMVTTTIRYALGMDDMMEFDFKATTAGYDGSLFEYDIIEEEEAFITLEWKWRYGDDHAPSGTYDLNVTTEDRSGNIWWQTQSLRIITNTRPSIDFVLGETGIVVENAYTKKTGYINATIGCYGEEGLKGLMPLMIFEVTTPEATKDIIYASPAINTESTKIVTVPYYFNASGTYIIKVEVNPRDYPSYEESNDLGDADENNEATLTITVGNKPKTGSDDEWYEEILNDIEDEPLYQGGIVAAIVVVISVIALIVRRRRSFDDEYDDEYDDDYVL